MAPEGGWRRKLYVVIFESESPAGRRFDVGLLWAIVASVFLVALESDSGIRQEYGYELRMAEWFFTILFTCEYVLRLICVQRPAIYARSFFGIIDFISIAPTYLSFFIPGSQFLVVVRAVRLLRVFRVLKLVRYSNESQILLRAMKASQAKITVFLGTVLTLVIIFGTFMHLIEEGNPGFANVFQGMYWAIVTMTTVGYGDVVPVTMVGKLLASIIMIMGYGIIAVPTGIVSAELTSAAHRRAAFDKCQKCRADLLHSESAFCHLCGAPCSQGTGVPG